MVTAQERAIIRAADRIKAAQRKQAKAKIKGERRARGKADRGRVRDTAFLAYLRGLPCEARHTGGCFGPVQAAHVSYRVEGIPNSFGRGVKNHDRHANPLCAFHHHCQHMKGDEEGFWALLGKNAYETAAKHYAEYQGGASSSNREG
jgi:hypothetical protein